MRIKCEHARRGSQEEEEEEEEEATNLTSSKIFVYWLVYSKLRQERVSLILKSTLYRAIIW